MHCLVCVRNEYPPRAIHSHAQCITSTHCGLQSIALETVRSTSSSVLSWLQPVCSRHRMMRPKVPIESGAQPPFEHVARRRNQYPQSERIRQKPRRAKRDPSDTDQNRIDQLLGRHLTMHDLLPHAMQHAQPFKFCKKDPSHGSEDDEENGMKRSEHRPDLKNEIQFKQGKKDEHCQKPWKHDVSPPTHNTRMVE